MNKLVNEHGKTKDGNNITVVEDFMLIFVSCSADTTLSF